MNSDNRQILSPEGLLQAKVHRKYLHSNSTSHIWPFSAIAELIDNAYDPDVAAKHLKIDVEDINEEKCLSFTDDGNGMTQEKLHQMLSFGFCDKEGGGGDDDGRGRSDRILGSTRSHIPLGQYGNGFKSGSMRLGKDALVFTRASHAVQFGEGKRPIASDATMSVGLLSQTFLEEIRAETVLVPIVTWNAKTKKPMQSIDDRSLDHILSHSIFSSVDELFQQFDLIESAAGTRIVIYNLNKGLDTLFELDFDSDDHDILLYADVTEASEKSTNDCSREEQPLYRTSLKEYCSILFLTTRLRIGLRKSEVKSKRLLQNLIRTQEDIYKPKGQDKKIHINFGQWDKERRLVDKDYGVLYYFKNRLIKAYEKIGCQKKNEGIGVIAILDIPPGIDDIVPIHNKQDFLASSRFSSLTKELAKRMNNYCREKSSKVTGSTQVSSACEEDDKSQISKSLKLSGRRSSKLIVKMRSEDHHPSTSGLAQSPLATTKAKAPLANSQLDGRRSGALSPSSSAGLSGELNSAEVKQPLLSPVSGRICALSADNSETNALNEFETENTPPEITIAIEQTTPATATNNIPSSIATAAISTVSMETVAVADSSSATTGSSTETEVPSESDRGHVIASVGEKITSSVRMKQEAESTSGEQIVGSSALRTQLSETQPSSSSHRIRATKSVQTDEALEKFDAESQTEDDITFRCLATAARQLEQLRLNVSRLLSLRLAPSFSVNRLEEVDAAFEQFVRNSIDNKTTSDKTESFVKEEEDKKQNDDDDSSNDGVRHDVSKLLPNFDDCQPKENEMTAAETLLTSKEKLPAEEKEKVTECGPTEGDRVEPERSTWKTRLGLDLCRPPLNSYTDSAKVTPRSRRSSTNIRETPNSSSKRCQSHRIDDYFYSKKPRSDS